MVTDDGIASIVRTIVASRPCSTEPAWLAASTRECLARSAGQQPVVECRRDLVVGLEPSRCTRVQVREATRRAPGQLGDERGPHQGVDLEPAGDTQAGHEQAAGFGAQELVADVVLDRSARRRGCR